MVGISAATSAPCDGVTPSEDNAFWPWADPSRACSIARQDDVLHQRIDLPLPLAAAEHAIVADARLHMVALEVGAQADAEVVRRDRLADRADVVLLALDGEQHGAPDRLRLDPLAAEPQRAARQRVVLEDEAHGLQVEL